MECNAFLSLLYKFRETQRLSLPLSPDVAQSGMVHITMRIPEDLLPPVGQRAAVIRQALREYYRRHARQPVDSGQVVRSKRKLSRAG
jgi:hypothetical protein